MLNPAVRKRHDAPLGAAGWQSAGISGARRGPTGAAHHQDIEVGIPGGRGMVSLEWESGKFE